MTALRGVNFGGWLVTEKWMTNSLFDGLDAEDESGMARSAEGIKRLKKHHQTFITEDDWRWCDDHNIRLVRIPVGYWVFGDEPPFLGTIKRLDWAFEMARKYRINILVSLHAAPGSQNGQVHSGEIGGAGWFRDIKNRDKTVVVLKRLAERYRDDLAFWGLELLNEPRPGLFSFKLRRFYHKAHETLSSILKPHTRLVFSDAFTPRLLNGALRSTKNLPTTIDIHWYHFALYLFRYLPLDWYSRLILPVHRRLIKRLQRTQAVLVGEWSGVISGECFRYYPQNTHEHLQDLFAAEQMAVYDQADAWCYWSYKTEAPGIWNFRSMVDDKRLVL